MAKKINNPCWHKLICQRCPKVEVEQRPKLCSLLKCPHYTPCSKCEVNRELENGVCEKCTGKKDDEELELELAASESQELSPVNLDDMIVTPPGVPHPNYSDREREYYNTQWQQYAGYYRDPSAYPMVHQMIMLEIELMLTANRRIRLGRAADIQDAEAKIKSLEKREDGLITLIGKLRSQLPEKEAQEMTDDEKSLAMILERWTKERVSRYQGGVSRIISPGAIALNAVLHFKLDLKDILKRLGYKQIPVQECLDRLVPGDSIPERPEEIAEFLGMMVRERIASADLEDEDDVELPQGLKELLDDPEE